LETREKNLVKTYLTANFKEGFPDNVSAAIDEFEDKYGSRVYDRIFKMFNIVIFNGKSFRK
jgi:DNA replication protein DnaC